MRDQDVNLYDFDRLRAEFGAFVEGSTDEIPARTERDLLGESYRHTLGELTRIVAYQWRQNLTRSALKGFLLHGGVGIGKTSTAKRLTYELGRLFGETAPDGTKASEVVLILVDGADIARGRYGESEEQIRDLFAYAREGESSGHGGHGGGHGHGHGTRPKRRTIMLFDDVESLFLTRSSTGAKEWHFSQNSVFFHNVDELDTSATAIVLTTNRIDLLDEAIIDRFLPYEFGAPPAEVLDEVARDKARQQGLNEDDLKPVLDLIHLSGQVHSIREVQRLVMRAYVNKALA
jgi:AAA+ superfamily predicted ATPase